MLDRLYDGVLYFGDADRWRALDNRPVRVTGQPMPKGGWSVSGVWPEPASRTIVIRCATQDIANLVKYLPGARNQRRCLYDLPSTEYVIPVEQWPTLLGRLPEIKRRTLDAVTKGLV